MEVLINNVVYVPKHTAPRADGVSLRFILINARQHCGETLQKAADEIGISKTHLWELEKGKSCNPCYELLRDIVKHYGIEPRDIFGL